MIEIEWLGEDQHRAAHDLVMAALHRPRVSDERWAATAASFEPGRTLGAWSGSELVGTAGSYSGRIVVPGGGSVAVGAVSRVAVRADWTRRGGLRELMSAQLADLGRRGEPVAALHASEAGIYGRFAYGVATRSRRVELAGSAGWSSAAPVGGRVRLVDPDRAGELLPAVYARAVTGPGMITRSAAWWSGRLGRSIPAGQRQLCALHHDSDGAADGFVLCRSGAVEDSASAGARLVVQDLQGASAAARAGLWRFVLGIDLVDAVVASGRPLGEPLEWWLADRRECRVGGVQDELWVRLVDVAEALSAREYGPGEPVVAGVCDELLPGNGGCYRVGADGVWRVPGPADVDVDVAALGSLYLGDVAASVLAEAGRVRTRSGEALAALDRLFVTSVAPWCGTMF